jgi:pimeloyl-ACP methyl ester carboxylesterase
VACAARTAALERVAAVKLCCRDAGASSLAEITLENGITLAYDEAGSRTQRPLVLIHGVSMGRRYFHRQLGPLAEHCRVIAVDLRGHGGSEKVESGHTIPQYARDLDAFIRGLALSQPVLLGWSMGAFVTFEYIKQFGTAQLGGLVVVDESSTDFKWDGYPHGFVDLPTLHSFMTDIQDDRMAFLRHLVQAMFNQAPSEADAEWMVAECARLPIGSLSAILFDQSVQDYREVVPTIDVPTLICWGRHDALLPVSGAENLRQSIPHARVELFEDSGHCPFLEEADRFNDVVETFMASL